MAKKERVRRNKGGKEETAKVVLLHFYNTHFTDFGAFVRKKNKHLLERRGLFEEKIEGL